MCDATMRVSAARVSAAGRPTAAGVRAWEAMITPDDSIPRACPQQWAHANTTRNVVVGVDIVICFDIRKHTIASIARTQSCQPGGLPWQASAGVNRKTNTRRSRRGVCDREWKRWQSIWRRPGHDVHPRLILYITMICMHLHAVTPRRLTTKSINAKYDFCGCTIPGGQALECSPLRVIRIKRQCWNALTEMRHRLKWPLRALALRNPA